MRGERRPAGPHDQQHADEADTGCGPSPPADLGAHEQRGASRHRQRHELQDAEDVGHRHVHERGEEGDGAAEVGGGAPQHGRRQRVRQVAQDAAGDDEGGAERRREQPAQEDRLAGRQVAGGNLHQRVVDDEHRHRRQHGEDAADVVGAGVGGDGEAHRGMLASSLTGKQARKQPPAATGC